MTTPYVGEIRLFAFSRIPNGWFACDGSMQSIQQYEVLYTLLGLTYGGNSTTFGLPDLRGQVPIHQGTGSGLTTRVMAQTGGTETVTVLTAAMPAHSHSYNVTSTTANTAAPGTTQQLGASVASQSMYGNTVPASVTPYVMAAGANANSGNDLPHENMMPTLAVSFCIAWQGIYPSQQ
ncbi:phage tail protein [Glaciimonas sp. GG7]